MRFVCPKCHEASNCPECASKECAEGHTHTCDCEYCGYENSYEYKLFSKAQAKCDCWCHNYLKNKSSCRVCHGTGYIDRPTFGELENKEDL